MLRLLTILCMLSPQLLAPQISLTLILSVCALKILPTQLEYAPADKTLLQTMIPAYVRMDLHTMA